MKYGRHAFRKRLVLEKHKIQCTTKASTRYFTPLSNMQFGKSDFKNKHSCGKNMQKKDFVKWNCNKTAIQFNCNWIKYSYVLCCTSEPSAQRAQHKWMSILSGSGVVLPSTCKFQNLITHFLKNICLFTNVLTEFHDFMVCHILFKIVHNIVNNSAVKDTVQSNNRAPRLA